MPVFIYKGFGPEGEGASGEVEASGYGDAVLSIRSRGILIESITEKQPGMHQGPGSLRDESFLPNMTRQISILLSASVPLTDALQSLLKEHRGPYRTILQSIKESVEGGASLGRSLELFSPVFPEFYVHMVKAGETTGDLPRVLGRLAMFLEKQDAIKAKIRSAMIYPVVMMAVSSLVMLFLFTFVIPKIVKIFRDTKAALPFITQVLIAVSNVIIYYWWLLALCVIVVLFLMKRFVRNHRIEVDKVLLKTPGGLLQSLYYARFSRVLGFLIEGGMPMLRALRLSAKSIGNKAVESSVLKAEAQVAEGQRLSAALEGFPPVLLQLISTGEKSGRLSENLKHAADAYEEAFNRKVEKAIALIEPSIIIAMGIIVCFIVLGVLLPMFQLNQLVK